MTVLRLMPCCTIVIFLLWFRQVYVFLVMMPMQIVQVVTAAAQNLKKRVKYLI